jgi:hypothetical protein
VIVGWFGVFIFLCFLFFVAAGPWFLAEYFTNKERREVEEEFRQRRERISRELDEIMKRKGL